MAKPEITSITRAGGTFHTICGKDYEVTVQANPGEAQRDCLIRHAKEAMEKAQRQTQLSHRILDALP